MTSPGRDLISLVGKRLWSVEHYLSLKKCIFPILALTRIYIYIYIFLISLTSDFLVNYNIYVIMSFLTHHSLRILVQLKPFWNFVKHEGSRFKCLFIPGAALSVSTHSVYVFTFLVFILSNRTNSSEKQTGKAKRSQIKQKSSSNLINMCSSKIPGKYLLTLARRISFD